MVDHLKEKDKNKDLQEHDRPPFGRCKSKSKEWFVSLVLLRTSRAAPEGPDRKAERPDFEGLSQAMTRQGQGRG